MTITEGQTLTGPQFAEPMRVDTVRVNGAGGVPPTADDALCNGAEAV